MIRLGTSKTREEITEIIKELMDEYEERSSYEKELQGIRFYSGRIIGIELNLKNTVHSKSYKGSTKYKKSSLMEARYRLDTSTEGLIVLHNVFWNNYICLSILPIMWFSVIQIINRLSHDLSTGFWIPSIVFLGMFLFIFGCTALKFTILFIKECIIIPKRKIKKFCRCYLGAWD